MYYKRGNGAGGAYVFSGHSQPDVTFKAQVIKTTAKVGRLASMRLILSTRTHRHTLSARTARTDEAPQRLNRLTT